MHLLSGQKKILAYSVKLLVGLLCFWIIYSRLQLNVGSKDLVLAAFTRSLSVILIIVTCFLMPLNWGIEAYKWKLITTPVEAISLNKAFRSVLAGVCVGNLAPGRSTEFLAKILFFKPEHRALISLLHFVNGMFQLFITITAGVFALFISFSMSIGPSNIIYLVLILAFLLLILFTLIIVKFEWLQRKLFSFKWLKAYKPAQVLSLSKKTILVLLLASGLRYMVFTIQFYLLLLCFGITIDTSSALCSIAVYFMLTSVVPMISVVEPAIRAAIALFVFHAGPSYSFQLVAVSTMLWLINIVLPSAIGYLFILKEKFIIKSFLR